MTLSFSRFLGIIISDFPLLIVTLLFIVFTFVSAWTDAPNSIVTGVTSASLNIYQATGLAVVFNFLGAFLISTVNMKVAQSIGQLVNFSPDSGGLLLVLRVALFVVILWSLASWSLGLPVSKTHGLISAMTGAGLAYYGKEAIDYNQWIKTLKGFVLVLVAGFLLAFILVSLIKKMTQSLSRKEISPFFPKGQAFSCGLMSFVQGAQGGQKFNAIFILILAYAQNQAIDNYFFIPSWVPISCALVLALGTAMAGLKIIRTLGEKMVRLEPYEAFSSDIATAISLGVTTLMGLPVSTTHSKTAAMLGAGAGRSLKKINWRVALFVFMVWLGTFVLCLGLSYLLVRLILMF
ncbi:MAG: inorganic phosphate transporter [Tissierellia bacterium]|nr:inorganic phosphate transporter [Tissierellia bacterium]